MRRKIILSFFLALFSCTIGYGQNERFKALFLYNFTRYLEWPAARQSGDFVISVVGDTPLVGELKIIASKRKVGVRTIVIKPNAGANDIGNSHMVYVAPTENGQLARIIASARGRGVVVVSDTPGGIAQGAAFNFVEKGGKQQFEMSPKRMEQEGLSVSNALLNLGIIR